MVLFSDSRGDPGSGASSMRTRCVFYLVCVDVFFRPSGRPRHTVGGYDTRPLARPRPPRVDDGNGARRHAAVAAPDTMPTQPRARGVGCGGPTTLRYVTLAN